MARYISGRERSQEVQSEPAVLVTQVLGQVRTEKCHQCSAITISRGRNHFSRVALTLLLYVVPLGSYEDIGDTTELGTSC